MLIPTPKILKGFSFRVSDLIVTGAWSETHQRMMIVWTDRTTEIGEYGETMTFGNRTSLAHG